MPVHHDDSGRRWVELEFILPGTPEQLWHAMATGPGMSSWFTPTVVDEKIGGTIEFDMDGEPSYGTVTAWDPPTRFAYEERDWNGDAPALATEVVITSRSGDNCVVRMVHSLFTSRDDWDDEMEGFEQGWVGCFEVLRCYLENFAGKPAASIRATASSSAPVSDVWARLTGALDLSGADHGQKRRSPDSAPRFSGVVQRVHQAQGVREMTLVIDEPAAGVISVGSCRVGEHTHAAVGVFLYGDDASAVAAEEQSLWSGWFERMFE